MPSKTIDSSHGLGAGPPAPFARHSPAAERNKRAIWEVVADILPSSGLVLEVASGSGQHTAYFANARAELVWQPSDSDLDVIESIRAHRASAAYGNVLEPVRLDVIEQPWPIGRADAIVCINMIHIAPWAAAGALLVGAARLLSQGQPLVLYGPFRMAGRHTAPSNAAFDENLKSRNPEWGVRDLEQVTTLAAQSDLTLGATVVMPANNFVVVYRRD
jgi:hypothetical protein